MPRIYCNGVFDLCHIGHIKQFEQASKYGHVVVGVHSDADVSTYKRYKCSIRQTGDAVRWQCQHGEPYD